MLYICPSKLIKQIMTTLNDINFEGKCALIRVDFNVPLDEQQRVTDSTRIEAAVPTIEKILKDGGKCVLMSHLGRPKGVDQSCSLKHIVPALTSALGFEPKFSSNTVGEAAEKAVNSLSIGEVLLLENLRFQEEETKGDQKFAEQLSRLGDVYVNDAFGTAHRAHASTAIVANFFPKAKCFGLLLAKEIDSIAKVMEHGEKPITAILGGAKVSSKITIIDNILEPIDHLIIGGGMAYTFIKAQGGSIGDSLVEDDKLDLALSILARAKSKNVKVHLPIDTLVADSFSENAQTAVFPIGEIPSGWMGLDIGPKTREYFAQIVAESRTILWNGPVGVFEMSAFSEGTKSLGKAIAAATKTGAFSLVGGGDSVAAVKHFDLTDQMSYVSTGGGAMLESLEGKTLPGVAAVLN